MGEVITCHVGLDTGKAKSVGCAIFRDGSEDIEFEVVTERHSIRRLVRRLTRKAGSLRSTRRSRLASVKNSASCTTARRLGAADSEAFAPGRPGR